MSVVTTYYGNERATQRSRTFVVLADHSVLPRLITVEAASGAVTLDDAGPSGVLVWLSVIAVCLLLIWRWWIRPWRVAGLEGLRIAI